MQYMVPGIQQKFIRYAERQEKKVQAEKTKQRLEAEIQILYRSETYQTGN